MIIINTDKNMQKDALRNPKNKNLVMITSIKNKNLVNKLIQY